MVWPFIWTNVNLFYAGWCFVPSLVEFGQVVLEKMKMWKVYDNANNDDNDNDVGRISIRKAHLSLRLRWAKKLMELWRDNLDI